MASYYQIASQADYNNLDFKQEYNNFNKFNINLGFIRLVQTRDINSTNCNFGWFKIGNNTKITCNKNDIKNLNYSNYIQNVVTYDYQKTKGTSSPYKGIFNNYYYDEGFYFDISLTPQMFDANFETLIKMKWIDEHSKSIIFNFTFYNINMSIFFLVKLIFENNGDYYQGKSIYNIINISLNQGATTIFCIIFSVINIICMIILLKKSKFEKKVHEKKLEHDKLEQEENGIKQKQPEIEFSAIARFFDNIKIWFELKKLQYISHYNYPGGFQVIALLSFIMSYVIFFIRVDYYQSMVRLRNKLDPEKFNDLSSYVEYSDFISSLNLALICISAIPLLFIMSHWFETFKIIVKTFEEVK